MWSWDKTIQEEHKFKCALLTKIEQIVRGNKDGLERIRKDWDDLIGS